MAHLCHLLGVLTLLIVHNRVQDLRHIPEFEQLGLHLSVVVWEAEVPTAYRSFGVFDTSIIEGASLLLYKWQGIEF